MLHTDNDPWFLHDEEWPAYYVSGYEEIKRGDMISFIFHHDKKKYILTGTTEFINNDVKLWQDTNLTNYEKMMQLQWPKDWNVGVRQNWEAFLLWLFGEPSIDDQLALLVY